MKFVTPKKVWQQICFHPSLLLLFLDPGSGMSKNQDPGSGINIPDPQHCLGVWEVTIRRKCHDDFNNIMLWCNVLPVHVKGWGRCLSEFIDWRYSHSCWYFRLSFVNCCPSKLFSRSTLPPPVPKYNIYTDSVWGGGGAMGVLSPVGDPILQEFDTLCLTRFKPTKFLYHPKQNPRRGGGLRQMNTCRIVPLLVNFFR